MKAGRLALCVVFGLWIGATPPQAVASELFPAQEVSLDLYGIYGSRDKGGSGSGVWGPGAGINYYFSRYLGVGADTYADAFEIPSTPETTQSFALVSVCGFTS
jgi:hypothetical protein